ncbi:MAG: AAA family ATPase [Deltaproteobacteria bacterium]|nr:AAA family ATPase [Deltaproteobacteria bacterium]
MKRGGIYVDKTANLAKMLETAYMTRFIARRRLFGKSLIVSTFKSMFSGQSVIL